MSKIKTKKNENWVSVRVRSQSKERATLLLQTANKKKFGRKIKLDDLFELAINLVTEDQLKMLQEKSMTNEDRKELLRQKYIEVHGTVTRDEFIGIMMKPEFFDFLKEHGQSISAA